MPELHPKVDRERKRRRGIGSAESPVGSSQRLQSMTDMQVQTRESERAKRGLNKETHSVTEAVEDLRKSVLYRFQGLRNRTLTGKRSKPDERKAAERPRSCTLTTAQRMIQRLGQLRNGVIGSRKRAEVRAEESGRQHTTMNRRNNWSQDRATKKSS